MTHEFPPVMHDDPSTNLIIRGLRVQRDGLVKACRSALAQIDNIYDGDAKQSWLVPIMRELEAAIREADPLSLKGGGAAGGGGT